VPVCTAGHDDCDGQATNGCEADLTLDPANCGTCGKSCPAAPNSNATCLASTCGLGACKNGFGDCNLDPSDGCEVDFSADGVNCGGCGIDCLGGGCNNKVCGPIPTVLASGQSAPEGIAVDATSVYWANQGGTIKKVALNGGNSAMLATAQGGGDYVAVDGTSVYWTGSNGVKKVALGGGNTTTLASIPNWAPYGIAIDSTNVYWTDYNGHTVMKVAVGGGNATTLASLGTMPVGIAVDATSVYWLDGILKQVSIAGGGVTVLSPAAGLALAVYGASVYWTDWGGGSVMKCVIAACVPTMLASGQSYPDALTVDGTNVYWANWGTDFNSRKDGTVMKVAIAGGATTQLASHQHFPWGIAIDGTSVYWTTIGGGTVMKAVK
jgi:hypothetical protein